MQGGGFFRGDVGHQTWKQATGSSALHVSFAHISPTRRTGQFVPTSQKLLRYPGMPRWMRTSPLPWTRRRSSGEPIPSRDQRRICSRVMRAACAAQNHQANTTCCHRTVPTARTSAIEAGHNAAISFNSASIPDPAPICLCSCSFLDLPVLYQERTGRFSKMEEVHGIKTSAQSKEADGDKLWPAVSIIASWRDFGKNGFFRVIWHAIGPESQRTVVY